MLPNLPSLVNTKLIDLKWTPIPSRFIPLQVTHVSFSKFKRKYEKQRKIIEDEEYNKECSYVIRFSKYNDLECENLPGCRIIYEMELARDDTIIRVGNVLKFCWGVEINRVLHHQEFVFSKFKMADRFINKVMPVRDFDSYDIYTLFHNNIKADFWLPGFEDITKNFLIDYKVTADYVYTVFTDLQY